MVEVAIFLGNHKTYCLLVFTVFSHSERHLITSCTGLDNTQPKRYVHDAIMIHACVNITAYLVKLCI